jgi:hypothetical protein
LGGYGPGEPGAGKKEDQGPPARQVLSLRRQPLRIEGRRNPVSLGVRDHTAAYYDPKGLDVNALHMPAARSLLTIIMATPSLPAA